MADEKVPQKDIIAVFKRLKSAGENKLCFDCRASNPTWASITYGVFLCIDCSAVHRGLGVHLTFIRSTQLDTNWTWLQIRSMQCGGNAKANAYFRQHNLTTRDAAAKYNSRVASMYREKLLSLAHKTMKEIGTSSLHIDQLGGSATTPEQKEVDFFNDVEHQPSANSDSPSTIRHQNGTQNGLEQKDVDVGQLSTSPPKKDVRVPTIGGRKPPASKKKGLGAKKGGLGATKTKANFSAIESEAQQQDKIREQANLQFEKDKSPTSPTEKSPSDVPLSSALVYKTASMRKEEQKLRQTDPKKAEQLERLGMGFGGKGNISHSVSASMQTVEQVKPDSTVSKSRYESYRSNSPVDSFFDSYDNYGMSSRSYDKGISEEPPSYETHFVQKDSWSSSNKSYKSEREDSSNSRSRSKPQSSYSDTSSDEVQKKFGSAKGISSDQLFGTTQDDVTSRRLDQFNSSGAISSADLFGEQKQTSGRTVDYQNIKDSMTQVTGKEITIPTNYIPGAQNCCKSLKKLWSQPAFACSKSTMETSTRTMCEISSELSMKAPRRNLSSMASGVIGSLQNRYSGNT